MLLYHTQIQDLANLPISIELGDEDLIITSPFTKYTYLLLKVTSLTDDYQVINTYTRNQLVFGSWDKCITKLKNTLPSGD